jgi:hypothetical protein
MALVVKDRVRETSTTTGTGALTLAGAVTGFQTFSSAIGNTNTTYYTITNGAEWETGIGTVGAGTLTRTTVLASSNAGSAVTFSAGTKDVFCSYPAGKSFYTDLLGTNVATALGTAVGSAGAFVTNGGVLGTPSSGTLTNCTFPTLNQNTSGSAASLSATLVATSGGTGQSTYAVGDLLQGATTNTLAKLASVATGNALISGGVTTASSWGKIGLTTHVSGTLPIANGGTNATTAAAANANLQGFTTTATATATTALTNTSTYYQYFTGTLTQTVTLPLNTDIQNGWSFHIANNSTGNLTVNSNSGALVCTILPQTTAHVTCVNATVNTAAAWDSGTTDFGSVTGTGAVVLATSPTLVTPTLGVASATSVNKVTLTAPATGSTLTIADGKTLTASNSLTLAGTDATTMTFPASSATVAGLGISQTFTGTQTFSGSTSIFGTSSTNGNEVVTVSATAATGTINYDISTQSVLYYTTSASANWTVNFRFSSGTSLDTALATGRSVTVVFAVTQGATAYYNNAVTVDGTSVTPKYQGGTAWTSGNASGIDVYSYTIVKTGSAAYTILASQTQFK